MSLNRKIEAPPTFCAACRDKFENFEAELCPEDTGFEEYIRSLEKQNTRLRDENRVLRLSLDAAANALAMSATWRAK